MKEIVLSMRYWKIINKTIYVNTTIENGRKSR